MKRRTRERGGISVAAMVIAVGVLSCGVEEAPAPAAPVTRDTVEPSKMREPFSAITCEPATEPYQRRENDFRFPIEKTPRPPLERPKVPAEPVEPLSGEYTAAAIENRIEGFVQVMVGVRSDGTVAGAYVWRGLPCGLEQKALEAVEQAEFRPGSTDGRTVDSQAIVAVKFRLPREP
jgi:TonB family protein